MAIPREEYIEKINFHNDITHDARFDKCVVKTNLKYRVIQIYPKIVSDEMIRIQILDQNFLPIEKTNFYKAQLFRVVDNLCELKRDENFLKYYESFRREGDYEILKFETSARDFYIRVDVFHDGSFPHVIEYSVKPIN